MGRPRRPFFEHKCAACGTPISDVERACPLCHHDVFKSITGPVAKDSMHDRILHLLKSIRRLRPRTVEQFTQGDCYKLATALQVIFPDAKLWYDQIEGHVLTEIGGGLYDITGLVWWVGRHPEHVVAWEDLEPRIAADAPNWKWDAN